MQDPDQWRSGESRQRTRRQRDFLCVVCVFCVCVWQDLDLGARPTARSPLACTLHVRRVRLLAICAGLSISKSKSKLFFYPLQGSVVVSGVSVLVLGCCVSDLTGRERELLLAGWWLPALLVAGRWAHLLAAGC